MAHREVDATPSPLAYPRRRENWVRTVALGSVLMLFAVLVIPGLVVLGYFLRVLRYGATRELTAPSFEDPTELAVDGGKALVVTVAYWLVPALLVAGRSQVGSAVGGGQTTIVVIAAVSAPFAYLFPAALAHLANEGSLAAGFDLPTIARVAFTRGYLDAGIYAYAIWLVLGIVAWALTGILAYPFVAVEVFVWFYAIVGLLYLFGNEYGDAVGTNEA